MLRPTKKTLYAAPAVEPVTVAEMRDHLRMIANDEDTLLRDYIIAARSYVEQITGRAFINQTWDVYFAAFDDELRLPLPPLSSITSVKYQDANNTQQTAASTLYEAGVWQEVGVVRPKYNQTWPNTLGHADDVVVRAVFGYGAAASSVPSPLRHAIKLLVAQWFENREPVVTGTIVATLPMAFDSLIEPYRVLEFH